MGIPSELLPASKLVKNQASLQGPALPDWQLEGILPALANRAEKFIQTQSAAKKPFLLYLPLTSPHTPLAVNAGWKGKSGLNNDFADLVRKPSHVLGRVLDALQAGGVENDTFVLFTSDNDCAAFIGVKDMEKQGHYPSGPLRDYKTSVYEGGHRVPFVVKWPGVVKAGSVCKQLVLQADAMATMAEILGANLPETAGEDSFSLMPLLKGEDRPIRTNAVNTACGGTPSSDQIQLVQVDRNEPGFLYYLPIYKYGEVPSTLEKRRKEIVGWAYAPILASAIGEHIKVSISTKIDFAVYEVGGDGQMKKIYGSSPDSEYEMQRQVYIGGKAWIFKASYTEIGILKYHWFLPLVFFVLVSTIYSLLCLYIRRLILNKEVTENRAKNIEDQFQALINGSSFLIMSTDVNGVIVTVNKTALRLLGFTQEELFSGSVSPELFHRYDEMGRRRPVPAGAPALE